MNSLGKMVEVAGVFLGTDYWTHAHKFITLFTDFGETGSLVYGGNVSCFSV